MKLKKYSIYLKEEDYDLWKRKFSPAHLSARLRAVVRADIKKTRDQVANEFSAAVKFSKREVKK